ncbi:MBL fold metallo-hydrolase [Helicobacter sp. 23-1045]
MELLSKAFGVYETNCYILRTKMGEFIIDAGVDSAKWVCENVRKPLAILNTHGHFDHIWCNAELKKLLGVPIYCPKGDAFMLKSDCFDLGLTPCAADFEVEPNAIFRFGDIEVEFMHFAGHTPGCSMIKISKSNSSLGMQFRTCENFGDFADSKSSLNPQNSHKYKSHTANTRIVLEADSALDSANEINIAESQNLPLPCGGGLRGWVDSAKQTKIAESNKNCHIERSEISQNGRDSSLRTSCFAQNDKKIAESNAKNTHPLAPSAREGGQNAESANQIKNAESCTKTQNLKIDGCFASLTKQGKAEVSLFNPMDCHDFALQNLAMTDNSADSANRTNIAESSEKSPKNTESSEIYIFSGDFIFYRTIGRSDFPYSSPKDMRESLKRFGEIPYNATLYPGHGQPTTIKDEQKNLPFYLRGLV